MHQKIGELVNWVPSGTLSDWPNLPGKHVSLERLDVQAHGSALYHSIEGAPPELWTYLPYGPFGSEESFQTWLSTIEQLRDPWFYTITVDNSPRGLAAFMRADTKNGVIEIGNIWFAPSLQRTTAATEAIFLLMQHAFEVLMVRRLEWKCDSCNAPSMQAALRFGFKFEGVFRQHMIIKSRNRDTAWYSIIDAEWPGVSEAILEWLDPANFDATGVAKAKLRVP
jgi:RimJ/RimL family protein N-acetyltransferase